MTDIVERLPPLKPLPDCMMPDGAQPCIAFSNLEAEIERLRAQLEGSRLACGLATNERDALEALLREGLTPARFSDWRERTAAALMRQEKTR